MGNSRTTVRAWLNQNGYSQISEMIEQVQAEWKTLGKHTRRNWWDVLSGGKGGCPHTIYGRQFPVLQAAQIRQGKPVTENAIKGVTGETDVPSVSYSGRWKNIGSKQADER